MAGSPGSSRRAVVVGGGIAGLAAAGALSRTGWEVTLLERHDGLRADGAALLVWPNGVHALRALGVGRGLDTISTPLSETGFRRPDGRWLTRVDTAAIVERLGAPVVAVHRQDLYDALVAQLGDVQVRTGVNITAVRGAGSRLPAVGDGTSWWEGELLVAADGINSAVRAVIAPESRVAGAGHVAWRAVVPAHRAPSLDDSSETAGAGHRFLYTSLGNRGVYWAATAPGASRPEPPEVQLDLLRRWFAGWHHPVTALLDATRPQDLLQHPVADLDPLPRNLGVAWGAGGVALIGDAGHAMTPNLGIGACLALEDAVSLGDMAVASSTGEGLHQSLQRFSRIRGPRVARLVRRSRRLGSLLQARGTLTVRARDAMLSGAPAEWVTRSLVAAAAWRPPER